MPNSILSASDPFFSRMASTDAAMSKAKSGLDAKRLASIDESSKDFESMFVSQMLQPMFETVQTDSEFGGGQAEDTWKSMMVDQYGKEIVNAGGIGLSSSIKAKMIEMQEAAQGHSLTQGPADDLIKNIAAGSLDSAQPTGSN